MPARNINRRLANRPGNSNSTIHDGKIRKLKEYEKKWMGPLSERVVKHQWVAVAKREITQMYADGIATTESLPKNADTDTWWGMSIAKAAEQGQNMKQFLFDTVRPETATEKRAPYGLLMAMRKGIASCKYRMKHEPRNADKTYWEAEEERFQAAQNVTSLVVWQPPPVVVSAPLARAESPQSPAAPSLQSLELLDQEEADSIQMAIVQQGEEVGAYGPEEEVEEDEEIRIIWGFHRASGRFVRA